MRRSLEVFGFPFCSPWVVTLFHPSGRLQVLLLREPRRLPGIGLSGPPLLGAQRAFSLENAHLYLCSRQGIFSTLLVWVTSFFPALCFPFWSSCCASRWNSWVRLPVRVSSPRSSFDLFSMNFRKNPQFQPNSLIRFYAPPNLFFWACIAIFFNFCNCLVI